MKSFFLIGICCLLAIGCDSSSDSAVGTQPNDRLLEGFESTILENGEPSHVAVQHILIAFYGSLPGKFIRRTQSQAQELANDLLEQAKAGGDFDAMVERNTDDEPPGIYKLANIDQPDDLSSPDRALWTVSRTKMVPAFGDVGFGLAVGEIGMSEFDQDSSPYGWHIIKRLK